MNTDLKGLRRELDTPESAGAFFADDRSFSLDIPFYRIDTSGERHSHSVLFGRSLTLHLAVASLKKIWQAN